MRAFGCHSLLCCLLWLPAVGAADQPAVAAVLDRALEAAGGKALLTRFQGATWRGKGKFLGVAGPVAYDGEWTVQPPERARIVTRGRFDGKDFERTLVINGDRGWTRTDGVTEAMDRGRLAEEKERLHAAWVATLTPLARGGSQVTLRARTKVKGRTAVGLKVKEEGHRAVELYFDALNGRLLKSVTRAKNPKTGVATTEEVFYSDYRDVGGIKRATRITVKANGKPFAEGEITDFKALIEVPRGAFDRP
jgi:hypothetical protein